MGKNSGFTLAVVLALGLGIGANTAIFSVVNAVLLRPLPYRGADRLAMIWQNSPAQGFGRIGPSGPNYLDFRDQSSTFEDMTLFEAGSGTVTGFGEPAQVPGMRVSTNFLSLFGYRPALGRDFLPGEGWNQRIAIVSHGVWERFLESDPNAIGRRVTADGLTYTIIGVLPREFWSPVPCDLLVPFDDSDLRKRDRMRESFGVIGHLKPGVSPQQAVADLTVIQRRISDQFAGMKGWAVTVQPLRDAMVENARTGLLLLLGTVVLVLLIACANLANLQLSRAAARAREVAVRMALGARRWRLLRQMLTESVTVSLAGGATGLLFAWWGIELLERLVPLTIRGSESGEVLRPAFTLDGRVLAFTLLVSVATGLIFGLAPAFVASRTDIVEPLKESARTTVAGGRRLRGLLAVSEVAVALVLLIASVLMLRSFFAVRRTDPGFVPERVLAMEMELPTDSKYRKDFEQADFFRRVLEKVQALPGVESAAVTSALPLDPLLGGQAGFLIEGAAPLPAGQRLPAEYGAVSPEYFKTMRIPLRKGRFLTDRDRDGRPHVAVISESLARRYWPDGSDPIGRRIDFGRRGPREIVGIVGDVKRAGLEKAAVPAIYTSYLQSPEMRMALVVRTTTEPLSMVAAVKNAIYAVDRDQPIYKIRSLEQVVADSQATPRSTLLLLGIFAAVALVLAAAGIYGVISYAVAQRTREIGIRIALGAQRRDILRMVLGQGMLLSLAGVAIGLLSAALLTRLISGLLFGVGATDATTFAGAAAFLILVALFASYLPARRATRLDPTTSLRYQ